MLSFRRSHDWCHLVIVKYRRCFKEMTIIDTINAISQITSPIGFAVSLVTNFLVSVLLLSKACAQLEGYRWTIFSLSFNEFVGTSTRLMLSTVIIF